MDYTISNFNDIILAGSFMISVAISGAHGRMGMIAQEAIAQMQECNCELLIGSDDDIISALTAVKPNILIDLTAPDVVFKHCKLAIENGIMPIIGTSGLKAADIDELKALASQHGVAGIIAPNFCISAILMMQFSKIAAQYFGTASIIEEHHPNKKDAPSGTAISTAELISGNKRKDNTHCSQESLSGALGAQHLGVDIHSIRRPGVIAKQRVIFADEHEKLTIEQESVTRRSFIAGIQLACRAVINIDYLAYGLEEFIFVN